MTYRGTLLAWLFASVAASMLTANPALTALAAGTFWLNILITWRPGEFPALTLATLMQWLSASIAVFRADIEGVQTWTLAFVSTNFDQATALSLVAVSTFALGARVAMGWQAMPLPQRQEPSEGVDQRLFKAWIVGNVTTTLVALPNIRGLSQLVGSLQSLKWVPVLLVFYVVLSHRRNHQLLIIVLITEVAMGFLSFFSTFKQPLYLLAIAFVGAQRGRSLNPRQLYGAAAVGVVAVCLGTVWSAIKTDYRSYLSGSTGYQITVVSKQEQADKFIELVSNLSSESLLDGSDMLVERISYVGFFGAAIDYVPAVRPFENGGRLLLALEHIFKPRIFFPDKAVLNDTADTEKYTGMSLSSELLRTSISLGYPAEAYIDAGPMFMFVPVFFFGVFHGLLARMFAQRREDPLLGQSVAAVILLGVGTLELGFTKMLGGSIVIAVTFWLAWRVGAVRLSEWLWGRGLKGSSSVAQSAQTAR